MTEPALPSTDYFTYNLRKARVVQMRWQIIQWKEFSPPNGQEAYT